MRTRRAFTLIELLVVVAIIGVLIAALAPALSGVRVRAQQIQCMSNMRSLGIAVDLYLDDHDGNYPLTTHSNPDLDSSWVFTLAPYLEDARLVQNPSPDPNAKPVWQIGAVRVCPRDPLAQERLDAGATSFMMNEYITVPAVTPFGGFIEEDTFNNRRLFKRPHATFLTFICADDTGVSVANDHTHSRTWFTWQSVLDDIATDRFGKPNAEGTGGPSNYLFADMSVESLDPAPLRERIEQGDNFARPTR